MPTLTHENIERVARGAREASRDVARLPRETKDRVLRTLAEGIESNARLILDANAADLQAAEAGGTGDAKLRRLALTDESLAQLAEGLRQIAAMEDPVNEVSRAWDVPSGLHVERVRTPLGVIAMIYEARPGVTIDAFALCFKAGNACLLKGGREANRSNEALATLAHAALRQHGVPVEALSLITTADRDEMRHLLTLADDIDLVIPRGGEALIRFVHEHSRIPTVQHFKGVCHIFVDATADADEAADLVATAKTSNPATCNTVECVLVHEDIAGAFVPRLLERCATLGVEVRGDAGVRASAGDRSVVGATDEDWGAEFLDLILAARVVGSLDEALAHIGRYSSNHTEAILTADEANAERFRREVTSSCVMVNASTRFNDGFQLGLGAEIGISTSKVHWYGPMGLEGLTTQRFVVVGKGQKR
jgi:glutamate-5-semialdehyde dehydrogenase